MVDSPSYDLCILCRSIFTIPLGAHDPTFMSLVVAKKAQFAAVMHTDKALETSIVLVEQETKTQLQICKNTTWQQARAIWLARRCGLQGVSVLFSAAMHSASDKHSLFGGHLFCQTQHYAMQPHAIR